MSQPLDFVSPQEVSPASLVGGGQHCSGGGATWAVVGGLISASDRHCIQVVPSIVSRSLMIITQHDDLSVLLGMPGVEVHTVPRCPAPHQHEQYLHTTPEAGLAHNPTWIPLGSGGSGKR